MNHMPLLVRREFWEHRSFVIAPAIVAAILLIGVTFGHVEFGNNSLDKLASPEFASKQYSVMTGILSVVALPYLISMGFLTVFYLLDSLYADRKDRSVLFWKSLPVSDRETVISKLVVAAIVLLMTAQIIGGLIAEMIGGDITPFSLSALVFAIVMAAAQAAFTVLASLMLARVYVQLVGGGEAEVSVPSSGT